MTVVDDRLVVAARDVPDVSVVIAVYNTMPYLTKCLESIARQSIGLDRLQVIAVDDGSTDGSDRELDRFASRYPGVFTIVRQANSGGPAAPSNRGLERARGRFVFFLGADDYLGPEALERLVSEADTHGSDVVLGKMVGDNGRFVPRDIFSATDHDVNLFHSALPFALSNTKLFRRDVLETHGVRYPEHVRFGSDQPFTLAACVHAKRISVLADYDYYYAVRRRNGTNITYASSHDLRLACTEEIMHNTARLLPAGSERDAVMFRSFASELSKLTRPGFLKLDRPAQERVCAGIGRLADLYLTESIRARLDASRRVRLSLAQGGYLSDLIAVVSQNAGPSDPLMVLDRGRLYTAYDCFRDTRGLPDDWFFVTDDPAELMARQLVVSSITWSPLASRPAMTITAYSPIEMSALQSADFRIALGDVAGRLTLAPLPDRPGTMVRVHFPLAKMMTQCPRLGGNRDFRVTVTLAGADTETPMALPSHLHRPRRVGRAGLRGYVVRPARQPDGELTVAFTAVGVRQVADRLKRRLGLGK